MKSIALIVFLLGSVNAFAYTMHRCETTDETKVIHILFDAADNYFVFAKLSINSGDPIMGVLQGKDRLRPRPLDPNHPPLTLDFGQSTFVFSFDAASATLTTGTSSESMVCCDDLSENLTCANRQ